MARFLNITPTYNPFTMDEMLKVPLLYDAAYKEADKNITDYKDKISYYKALAGDDERAKKLFSNYDSLLNNLANDYSIKNMQNVGKQLRDNYRDITAKFDKAEKDYNIYREMKLKNPELVGEIGNIMDYYGTNYKPNLINGKEFATLLGADIAALAQQQPYQNLGFVDSAHSKIMYGQGFTNNQLSAGFQDALSENPQSMLGNIIKNRLNEIGYDNLSPEMKISMGKWINTGLLPGVMKTQIMDNANFVKPTARSRGGSSDEGYIEGTDLRGRTLRFKTTVGGKQTVEYFDEASNKWKPETNGYIDGNGILHKPIAQNSNVYDESSKATQKTSLSASNEMSGTSYKLEKFLGLDKLNKDESKTLSDQNIDNLIKTKELIIIDPNNMPETSNEAKVFNRLIKDRGESFNEDTDIFAYNKNSEKYYILHKGNYMGDFKELFTKEQE